MQVRSLGLALLVIPGQLAQSTLFSSLFRYRAKRDEVVRPPRLLHSHLSLTNLRLFNRIANES
jgi:hypothetical protein